MGNFRIPTQAMNNHSRFRLGLVFADAACNLTGANLEAVKALSYPHDPSKIRGIHRLVRKKLLIYLKNPGTVSQFQSGKRTYRFRRVPLDGLPGKGSDGSFALILDRSSSELFIVEALMEAATRFGLSTREQETVELILRGLSSRDIAERMKISHHTVRTFLRMVMVKMDVASRSEIVAKVLHSC
jgi:DNA-binding CsgD family transcriptional regulator